MGNARSGQKVFWPPPRRQRNKGEKGANKRAVKSGGPGRLRAGNKTPQTRLRGYARRIPGISVQTLRKGGLANCRPAGGGHSNLVSERLKFPCNK